MKLPNGYGSVTKLSGNRRKPYLARVTLGWITDEKTGKCVQNRVPIGTFKTKKEALQALAEYGANPYDIQNNNLTLAELYQKWTESYFPTLESESSSRTITAAWRYCHAIHNMRVKDLRARHIKGIMEDGYIIPSRGKEAGQKVSASPGTKARIKSMFNLMLDYALEYELVDRNYVMQSAQSNGWNQKWIIVIMIFAKRPAYLSKRKRRQRGGTLYSRMWKCRRSGIMWILSALWTGFSSSAIWDGVPRNSLY